MAAPTVNVTCTASDQSGNPVALARYVAKLNQTEVYQGFIAPEQVEVLANAQGIAVLALFPNALGVAGSLYNLKAYNPDTGKKFLDTTISVPNSACNLHQILVQAPYPTVDASQQALVAAQQAMAAAQGALALTTAQAILADDDRIAAETAAAQALTRSADAALSQYDAGLSKADASVSKNSALATQTAINNIYRGALAADPATRVGGAANQAGDEYFSTSANLLKRWNGATWQASDISTANLAAPDGAGMVGLIRSATGSVATTLDKRFQTQAVSVFDFMTATQINDVRAGTALIDVTTALAAARAHIAGSARKPRLIFPAGVYSYSVSPNWAIQNAQIIADGEVRLRYTGTGNAVILDADAGDAVGPVAGLTFGVAMARFIVEATASAMNGVYVRSIHHSELNFMVRGAGTTYAGLRAEFAVCTDFKRTTVSPNQEGWYGGAKPQYGLYLTRRNVSEEVSYCSFYTPLLEGMPVGAQLEWALGNSFFGGAMEGCTDTGMVIALGSRLNKVFNTDFEANTVADVFCAGYENEFHGIDSEKYLLISSTGARNKLIGGSYSEIGVQAGATDNLITSLTYNRFNNAASISNAGTRTRMADLFNKGTAKHHNTVPSYQSIAGPASGIEYLNTTANDVTITPIVSGGSITYIGHNRLGTGNGIGGVFGQVTLSPNDGIIVLYTGTLQFIVASR